MTVEQLCPVEEGQQSDQYQKDHLNGDRQGRSKVLTEHGAQVLVGNRRH